MPDGRRQHRKGRKASRGTVLLLALLVMSSVVVAATGLGSLILSSLRQTRIIDNAVVAYYAAETSVEEALFWLRTANVTPTAVETPVVLGNGASWVRTVDSDEPVVYMTIPKDSMAEIALYDPDAPIDPTGISAVNIWWQDDCEGCSVLHTTLVGWLPQDISEFTATTRKYPWNTSSPTVTIPLGGGNLLYKLRLRAEGAALEQVEIRAVDDSLQDIELPGRVKMDARGLFGGTQQRITVTMPRQVPLSSLYDFVVFSECSLVKGGPVSCP